MRTRKVPRGARHLRAFAEFRSYLTDFVQGRYPFLWVVGRPGVAKTESIRAALRGREVYYRKGGQLTPLQFYIDCHHHRGQPIILDDSEHLLQNTLGARLISALGDTTRVKQLSYGTTNRALGDVPQSFSTTSSLCIIANKNTADEAIQSRAVTLYFDPTSLEIHRDAATWFWDQEIHDWMGQHLYRLRPPEARWYVIAYNDKQAARDWRQLILKAHANNRATSIVQDLEGDPACPMREDKARQFTELMGATKGASRATYFRLRDRLEKEGRLAVQAVPPVPLRRTRPPGIPSALELESMEAKSPDHFDEEPRPLDVPARETFARPITGQAPSRNPPVRVVLDDLLPGEERQDVDEGEGQEDQG
jgi:hypothetical protein